MLVTGIYNYYSDSWPNGPGSGDETPQVEQVEDPGLHDLLEPGEKNEPIGPGSGDELEAGENNDEPTGPGSGEELPPIAEDEATGPGSGEEREPDQYEKKALGSCNIISTASTCAEYIGSFWKAKDAEMNCGYEGAYSENPCPRPTMGGCQIKVATEFELITWHYTEGPAGFNAEVIPYASSACEATGSNWVQSN